MSVVDVVEFLTARLDEDEQAARAATSGEWAAQAQTGPGADPDDFWEVIAQQVDRNLLLRVATHGYEGGGIERADDARHIARHDPARVLADVAAKRAILALHSGVIVCDVCRDISPYLAAGDSGGAPWPCDTILLLAQPFADHPDFDPAWKAET